MEANWIGLVLVAVGLYLAFRLLGVVLRLLMWLVVLVGAYWFVAPALGWPTVSDLVYVLGPDFGGQRVEEVFAPARIADGVGAQVDGFAERVLAPELPAPSPDPAPQASPPEAAVGPDP